MDKSIEGFLDNFKIFLTFSLIILVVPKVAFVSIDELTDLQITFEAINIIAFWIIFVILSLGVLIVIRLYFMVYFMKLSFIEVLKKPFIKAAKKSELAIALLIIKLLLILLFVPIIFFLSIRILTGLEIVVDRIDLLVFWLVAGIVGTGLFGVVVLADPEEKTCKDKKKDVNEQQQGYFMKFIKFKRLGVSPGVFFLN